MEQDLKDELEEINKNLVEIKKKTGTGLWRSFLSGILTGLGSVVGVAIALAIAGYVLNVVGIIPAFRTQVNELRTTLENLQKTR